MGSCCRLILDNCIFAGAYRIGPGLGLRRPENSSVRAAHGTIVGGRGRVRGWSGVGKNRTLSLRPSPSVGESHIVYSYIRFSWIHVHHTWCLASGYGTVGVGTSTAPRGVVCASRVVPSLQSEKGGKSGRERDHVYDSERRDGETGRVISLPPSPFSPFSPCPPMSTALQTNEFIHFTMICQALSKSSPLATLGTLCSLALCIESSMPPQCLLPLLTLTPASYHRD